MVTSYTAAPGIDVVASHAEIPGFGIVPINAYVLKGSEPMLVETGAVTQRDDFMRALRTVIDPQDLRWIWLSHTDPDHIGALHQLLAENPRLRVITTFLGVGIMSLTAPLPPDRVYLLNPGEKLTIGDRTLTAFKPPVFDNPCTTGFYDSRSGALFSADSFGAMLQSIPDTAADIAEHELFDGQVVWATLDAPWLHAIDRGIFAAQLDQVRRMAPTMIYSNHLPPASGAMIERMLEALAAAPGARPFTGPNQAALEAMFSQIAAQA